MCGKCTPHQPRSGIKRGPEDDCDFPKRSHHKTHHVTQLHGKGPAAAMWWRTWPHPVMVLWISASVPWDWRRGLNGGSFTFTRTITGRKKSVTRYCVPDPQVRRVFFSLDDKFFHSKSHKLKTYPIKKREEIYCDIIIIIKIGSIMVFRSVLFWHSRYPIS